MIAIGIYISSGVEKRGRFEGNAISPDYLSPLPKLSLDFTLVTCFMMSLPQFYKESKEIGSAIDQRIPLRSFATVVE